MNTEKFKGVFPAFYACYDDNGEISDSSVPGKAVILPPSATGQKGYTFLVGWCSLNKARA